MGHNMSSVHLLDALPSLGRAELVETVGKLEPEDFDASGADILCGLQTIATDAPIIGDRGVTVQMIFDHHLRQGDLQGPRANQIRTRLTRMAGATIDPLMVPHLLRDTLDARFRRAVSRLAEQMISRADCAPLSDIDAMLADGVPELRRLRLRINPETRTRLTALGGAA